MKGEGVDPSIGNGRPSEKSAGQLLKEVTEDLSTLVRKEVELAKQELGHSVSEKAKGIAAFAILATLGFFSLIFMLFSIRDALVTVMNGWVWLADILTAVILLLIGFLAFLFAKKKMAAPISAEKTKESLKADVEMVKTVGRRNP
jgi:uncharacterized membrane protein YqjE